MRSGTTSLSTFILKMIKVEWEVNLTLKKAHEIWHTQYQLPIESTMSSAFLLLLVHGYTLYD